MRHSRPNYHLDQVGMSFTALAASTWLASYATSRVQGGPQDPAVWAPAAIGAWTVWLLAAAWVAIVAGFALALLARSLREQWEASSRPALSFGSGDDPRWQSSAWEQPVPAGDWRTRDAAQAWAAEHPTADPPPSVRSRPEQPRTDEPEASPKSKPQPVPQPPRTDPPTVRFTLPDGLWTVPKTAATDAPAVPQRTYSPDARHAGAR